MGGMISDTGSNQNIKQNLCEPHNHTYILIFLNEISFLVGGDGNIYEGRGWNVLGSHTSGYNSVGYGTCFIGNFMTENPVQAAQDVFLEYLTVSYFPCIT